MRYYPKYSQAVSAKRMYGIVAIFIAASIPLPAVDLDVGAGAIIDVAPFGIESKEVAVNAAIWLGPRTGFQLGIMACEGLSFQRSETTVSLNGRLWVFGNYYALWCGGGIRIVNYDDATVTPLALAGMRFEKGNIALLFPALALRLKPNNPDWEVWALLQWVL